MKAVAKKNHTSISYGENGTWRAFHSTDVKVVNGKKYWWDMYSSNLVSTNGHNGLNIEHSVAKSWWDGDKNDAYRDIVHLNPSNIEANSRKSNYPLAELSSVTWDNGVTFVGKPKSGQGGGASNAYEPHDDYKGDFARVFMYMFTMYDDISWKSYNTDWMYDVNDDYLFKPWAAELLLRWSSNDPVSDKERDRNDGINKEQGNRNPFIDLPDLADYLWGKKRGEKFYVDGHVDPNPGPEPDDPTIYEYTWLSENNTSLDEGWSYEIVDNPNKLDYIWSWKEYNGKGYLNASAFVAGNLTDRWLMPGVRRCRSKG